MSTFHAPVRRWVHVLAIGLLTCQLNTLPVSAQLTNRLQWSKPVLLGEISEEALVAARFDTDVYAATQRTFDDVRLLNANGGEVAYVLRHARGKKSVQEKRTWNPKDIKLQPLQNNGLEITFQIDTNEYPQWPAAIRLVSPVRNFQHHVRLETSTDGLQWQLLAEDLIFDYSQFMSVRDTEIMLPERSGVELQHGPEYYRLTIDEVTQEQVSQLMELTRNIHGGQEQERSERVIVNRQPFRIDRIELWHDEFHRDVPTDVEMNYALKVDRVEAKEKDQETYVYITAQREPLTAIGLETTARNFSRPCRVEYRLDSTGKSQDEGGDANWRSLGSAQIARIDFRTLKQEQLQVTFAETRAHEYRLVIENGDSPPLPVTSVVGVGPSYEVVFLADPGVKYSLAFGSESIDAAHYDTAAISASLSEGYFPDAVQLGGPTKLQVAPEPDEPLWKRLLSNGVFVTAVIAVLVAVLGFGLYRAANQLEAQ